MGACASYETYRDEDYASGHFSIREVQKRLDDQGQIASDPVGCLQIEGFSRRQLNLPQEDDSQARIRKLVSGINKTTQEAQYVSNEVGLLQEGTRNLQTQQARADTRVNTLSLARQEYQNGILQQQQQHTQKMTHPMY